MAFCSAAAADVAVKAVCTSDDNYEDCDETLRQSNYKTVATAQ